MTVKLAIVYHSGYGHTTKVAQAIAAGAKDAGAQVNVLVADTLQDADWAVLDAADAIIFGAPTYMGSLSGQFKLFMDATSKKWFTQEWKNKIAAGFTNSASYSGDKLASIQQLFHLAMQHGMIWVGQAESAPTLGDGETVRLEDINRIGSWSGLMTQSNAKSGPDIAPSVGDLETATRFGERVVTITHKMTGGTSKKMEVFSI